MKQFKVFLAEEYADYFKVIETPLEANHVKHLLNEYQEIAIQQLISQFGLRAFVDVYKDGGNVTTLHNARNNVFATAEDEDRFTYKYNRKEERTRKIYDQKLPGMRKEAFQNEEVIQDAYTGKELPKDGRAHIDHVVAASTIQNNDEARLYMSDEARGEMSTAPSNLQWTESRLNQSKGSKDLSKWLEGHSNKNKPGEDNADRFEVDREKAKKINQQAKEDIEKTIKSQKRRYYAENVSTTSLMQGHELGKRQLVGFFLYELQKALFSEMSLYFQQYRSYTTTKKKISEFSNSCKRVGSSVLRKVGEMKDRYLEGFAGGVLGNITTILFNTFLTTTKNMVRVINEGIQGLAKVFSLIVKRPKDMTTSELIKEASKIVSAAVSTAIGLSLTETFVIYLRTTPLAPFADLVGGTLGGIATGIVTATIVYSIDNIGRILQDVSYVLETITYDFKVSATEIRRKYQSVIAHIDEEYSGIIREICQEYERLYDLSEKAYDRTLDAGTQFGYSQELSAELKVSSNQILKNKQDIKNFFN